MTDKPVDQEFSGDELAGTDRGLRVAVAVRSDVGRVRSENQDFAITSTETESDPEHGHLMVVADGMGGHKGGATASRLAATSVKEEYLGSAGDDVAASLRSAIERANGRIHAAARENEDLEGMGTTTSAMVIRGAQGWIGHVGDSRIYRVRGTQIEQMTEDHSLVATMVKEGLLTAEEAETHPRRNVLQRSMGVSSEVEVDIVGPIEMAAGDRFILCSDGLHGLVSGEEMTGVVGGTDIERAADQLIDMALERGAHDNVTVIIAAVLGENDPSPATTPADQPPGRDISTDTTQPIPVTRVPESADGPAAQNDRSQPSMGSRGCLLRSIVIGLSILAIAGAFLLLVASDLFVSWFSR